jgi:hypothetical protein
MLRRGSQFQSSFAQGRTWYSGVRSGNHRNKTAFIGGYIREQGGGAEGTPQPARTAVVQSIEFRERTAHYIGTKVRKSLNIIGNTHAVNIVQACDKTMMDGAIFYATSLQPADHVCRIMQLTLRILGRPVLKPAFYKCYDIFVNFAYL